MRRIVCLIGDGDVRFDRIAKQEGGEYTNSEGRCDMVLSGTINRSGQDILETMILGFEEISRQYPEFVQIHEI